MDSFCCAYDVGVDGQNVSLFTSVILNMLTWLTLSDYVFLLARLEVSKVTK